MGHNLRHIVLLTAFVLLTACTSHDGADTGPDALRGEYFLAVSIVADGGQGGQTRVATESATAEEYKVNQCILALFNGDNEQDATLVKAYPVMDEFTTDADADVDANNATVRVVKLGATDFDRSKQTYALALINMGDRFKVKNGDELYYNEDTKLNGKAFSYLLDAANVLLDGQDATATVPAGGFPMANAPVSNKAGGNSKPADNTQVTTLTPIDLSSKIFDTETAARQHPTDILVERAYAKVQVESSLTPGDATLSTGETIKFNSIHWMFDNYATQGHVLRHMPTDAATLQLASAKVDDGSENKYRMVATADMYATGSYRTNWAEDLDYNTAATELTRYWPKDASVTDAYFKPTLAAFPYSPGDFVYCAENTMDENNLKQQSTTRVVLAIQFNDGSDFYSFQTLPNIIKSEADAAELLKKEEFRKNGSEFVHDNTGLNTWLTDYFTSADDAILNDITFGVTDEATSNAAERYCFLYAKDMPEAAKSKLKDSGKADEAKAKLNSIIKASTQGQHMLLYKNGIAYYPIRIKHFGDKETPWTLGAYTGNYSYDIAYPETNRKANYLGRYGVVRNNWYHIRVNAINLIGRNCFTEWIPTGTETEPDDEAGSWLNYTINVLPWGVHEQKFIFK